MSIVNPTGVNVAPPQRTQQPAAPTPAAPQEDDYDDSDIFLAYSDPPDYIEEQGPSTSQPSFQQQQQQRPAYPVQNDPAAGLATSFAAMNVNGAPQRATSLQAYDPVQRAGSAMSFRSANGIPRPIPGPGPPRHAQTMPLQPPQPHMLYHQHPPRGVSPAPSLGPHQRPPGNDYGGYAPPDQYYQHQPPGGYYPPPQQQMPPQQFPPQQYAPQHPPPQQWQQGPPPPPQGHYNQFHSVASNVLGMGPPPPSAPMGRPPPPPAHLHGGPAYPPPPPGPQSDTRSVYAASIASGHSGNSNYSDAYAASQSDFDMRPGYQRSGTSASLTPASVKSKAIDLKSPPYTKEYIDEYRQRIKGDPDPEAHFLYAKYLIDAAKHIRQQFKDKDEKGARKYSELLISDSLKVIRRLATQGNAYSEAQFFLANCHGTGVLGLPVDHERAYHLYLQAAKQDHAAACYRVAVCNEIGAGTKKEPLRAAAFYKKAASLGDTAAMYKLGTILINGSLEQAKNPRDGIGWLKRAAEQADEENPHALHELALLYEKKENSPVGYDPVYSKQLLTQAAQLGFVRSQYKLGQCYEYGTLSCPVDPKRSIAWYTKAAEKHDPEAELALSGWYLTGSEGVLKQSDSEAYLWARRSAGKCLAKAEYAVGYYTEVGIGTKPDFESAKRWYMHAAAQGHVGAMNRLTELKNRGASRRQVGRPTRQQATEECVIC